MNKGIAMPSMRENARYKSIPASGKFLHNKKTFSIVLFTVSAFFHMHKST